jgi:hypothetical protein
MILLTWGRRTPRASKVTRVYLASAANLRVMVPSLARAAVYSCGLEGRVSLTIDY